MQQNAEIVTDIDFVSMNMIYCLYRHFTISACTAGAVHLKGVLLFMKKRVTSCMFAALLCILNMRPSLEAGALVLKSQDDLLVPPDSQAVFAVEQSDGDEATTTSYYKDYSQVVTNETGGASNGYVATGTQPITDDSDPNVVLPGGITEKSYGECGAEGNNLTWSLDSEGVLTISGTGRMADWYHGALSYSVFFDGTATTFDVEFTDAEPPWYQRRNQICSVVIEEGVISIGACAFFDCSKLEHVQLPDSLVVIDREAWFGCVSLTECQIPDQVRFIDEEIFGCCMKLKSVRLPQNLDYLPEAIFHNCFGLTEYQVPEGVKYLKERAFDNCRNLKSITIPKSVEVILPQVFGECPNLETVSVSPDNKNYSADEGGLYNKQKTELVRYAQKSGRTFSVPESVERIGNDAFSGCSTLLRITLPEKLKAIGRGAFAYCDNLSEMNIPETVECIGASAFKLCRNMKSLQLPDRMTGISDYMLYGCPGLTEIVIPPNVTKIGDFAFFGCNGLNTINISDNVSSIGYGAFDKCAEELTLFGSTGSCAEAYAVENGLAFSSRGSVTEHIKTPDRTAPNTDKYYRYDSLESAFGDLNLDGNYSDLTDMQLLGNCAAGYTDTSDALINALADINADGRFSITDRACFDSMYKIDPLLYMSDWMKVYSRLDTDKLLNHELTILAEGACGPKSDSNLVWKLYSDGTLMFFGHGIMSDYAGACWHGYTSEIKQIILQDGITHIGDSAFSDCVNLKYLEIPDTVTSIGKKAFSGCDESFVLRGTVGSVAEKYAKNNMIKFEPIDEVSPYVTTTTATTTTLTTTTTSTNTTTSMTTTTSTKVTTLTTFVTATPTVVTTTVPTVTASQLPPLKLNTDSLILTNGERFTVIANRQDVRYRSNNTEVAVVSAGGIITAVGPGNAVITAIDEESNTEQIVIIVKPVVTKTTNVTTTTKLLVTTSTDTTTSSTVLTATSVMVTTSDSSSVSTGTTTVTKTETTTTGQVTVLTGRGKKVDVNFVFPDDAWSFSNQSEQFEHLDENLHYYRYMTDDEIAALHAVCSPVEWERKGGVKDYLYNYLNSHGTGTCYGMSLLALMNLADVIQPSDIHESAVTLRELRDEDEKVQGIVNYHQILQKRDPIASVMKESAVHKKKDAELIQEVIDTLNSGKPAIVIMHKNDEDAKEMHAVLAIGYEIKDENFTERCWGTEKEFEGWINLYDPYSPEQVVQMKINREEGIWCISNYSYCGNWLKNIKLRTVISDLAVLTDGSLFCQTNEQTSNNTVPFYAQMILETDGTFEKPKWLNQNEEGNIGGAINNDSVVIEDDAFFINGKGESNQKKYIMRYADDSYSFCFQENAVNPAAVEMEFRNRLYQVCSDALVNADFSPDGVSFSTGQAMYTLRTVQNLAPDSGDFYLLRVTGFHSGEIQFTKCGEGWILSSDGSLGTIEMNAESCSGTVQRMISTAANSIYIYAENSEKIGVRFNFKENDDVFETNVDDIENGDVNCDGAVDVADAQLVLIAYTERISGMDMNLTEEQLQIADVDKSKEISVEDAQYILQFYTENSVADRNISWDELFSINPNNRSFL